MKNNEKYISSSIRLPFVPALTQSWLAGLRGDANSSTHLALTLTHSPTVVHHSQQFTVENNFFRRLFIDRKRRRRSQVCKFFSPFSNSPKKRKKRKKNGGGECVTSDELPLFIAPSAFLPFFFFCFQFHALESLRSTTIVYKYIPTCC